MRIFGVPANKSSMNSTPGHIHEPMVGENVTLLVHTDDRPTWTIARIHSRNPFSVEFDSSSAALFAGVKHLLVIHDSGRKYSKGEGKIADLATKGNQAWITFSDFCWEPVDNRDAPRFETEVQTVIRTIVEHDGGITADDQVCVSKNLSLGGALLTLSKPVSKGQLVEFRATLEPGTTIRTMAVIAHTSEDGTIAGVNFIDYVGAARYSLHQYLSKLAA
jgi:hypothetical protein